MKITLEIDTEKPKDIESAQNILDDINETEDVFDENDLDNEEVAEDEQYDESRKNEFEAPRPTVSKNVSARGTVQGRTANPIPATAIPADIETELDAPTE